MNKKQLITEITKWQTEGLVTPENAELLKKRYSVGGKNTLAIIFSVIGSLLIAAGIVLIFAWNWSSLSLETRTLLSFLPLLAGQGIALFTMLKRRDSVQWREGAAVFWTGVVFASNRLIIQCFDLSVSTRVYLITCALLILPIMLLLNAATPLPIYFFCIAYWGEAALDSGNRYVPVYLALIGLGLLLVSLHAKSRNWQAYFCKWVCVLAGVPLLVILFGSLNYGVVVMCCAYFICLFAASRETDELSQPLKTVGAVGCAVSSIILATSTDDLYDSDMSLLFPVVLVAALLAGLVLCLVRRRKDVEGLVFTLLTSGVCLAATIAAMLEDTGILLTVFAMLAALGAGVCLIVRGVREEEMSTTNLGLIQVMAVVCCAFFGFSSDFLVRGLGFLIVGSLFLAANVKMLKKKKSSHASQSDVTHKVLKEEQQHEAE